MLNAFQIAIILPIFAVIPLSMTFAPSMNYIGAFFYVPLIISQMLIVQYVVRHLPETRNLPVDVAVQHLVSEHFLFSKISNKPKPDIFTF